MYDIYMFFLGSKKTFLFVLPVNCKIPTIYLYSYLIICQILWQYKSVNQFQDTCILLEYKDYLYKKMYRCKDHTLIKICLWNSPILTIDSWEITEFYHSQGKKYFQNFFLPHNKNYFFFEIWTWKIILNFLLIFTKISPLKPMGRIIFICHLELINIFSNKFGDIIFFLKKNTT